MSMPIIYYWIGFMVFWVMIASLLMLLASLSWYTLIGLIEKEWVCFYIKGESKSTIILRLSYRMLIVPIEQKRWILMYRLRNIKYANRNRGRQS